jgi:hypothetical protein
VLIEAMKAVASPLPVLSRGPVDPSTGRDRGVTVEPGMLPPFPTIQKVVPPASQPAARLGETVRLAGHHLAGSSVVARFEHRLLDAPNEVTVGTVTDPTGIDVALPTGASAFAAWPAGLYTVTVSLIPPGETTARESNVAAMALAPVPELPPSAITRQAATGKVSVTIGVRPSVRPAQVARLSLDGVTAVSVPHPSATASLKFEMGPVPAGPQWVRLVVDGVESILVDRSTEPPTFDATQSVTVPA